MNKQLKQIKEYIERADYHSLELDGIEISMTNPQGLEVHRFNTADSALDDFLLNGVQDMKYLINEVERLQQFEQKAIYTIEENKRLRETLNFYATGYNYNDTLLLGSGHNGKTKDVPPVIRDYGNKAREVLENK